MLLSNYLFTF